MDIVLISIDHLHATVTFLRSDGKEATLPLPSAKGYPTSAIARTTWAPSSGLLHFETTKRDQIVAELPHMTDFAPRRERLVIYLDQNHWSTLANAIHAPGKVRQSAEREAAERVIDLALAQGDPSDVLGAYVGDVQVDQQRDALSLSLDDYSTRRRMADARPSRCEKV